MINLEKIRKEKPIEELIKFSILNIDKPAEWTSFDVVNRIQHMLSFLGVKKAGHFGTLDPNVTGVLPICLENACKIQDLFMHHEKIYIGKMKIHKPIKKDELEKEMKNFIGKINQLPPRKSRVKRVVREREVMEFKLTNFDEDKNEAEFIAHVQAGTYIRKLCSDLGEKLRIGIQMSELRRIKAGLFSDKDKEFTSIENFEKIVNDFKAEKIGSEEKLRKILIPAEIISKLLSIIEVKSEFVGKLKNGSPIFEEMLEEKNINQAMKIIESRENFLVFCENKLIEVAKKTEQFENQNILAKPETVFS